MVWYSHLFKRFSQFVMIHTVKGFGRVDETEVDVFLEIPSFLYDPTNVGNLISGNFSFSKSILDIWKFFVCIMLQPSLQYFKHDLSSMGPWRRKWQPTPVFLTGELHGQRILVGYSPGGCKELDMTEQLTLLAWEMSAIVQ